MRQSTSWIALYTAWIISVIATVGSLVFSEIYHFAPCTLCWYQRILMYPLVIVLGIASYRHDRAIVPYVLPLSILGAAISLWQYLLQKIPVLATAMPCKVGVPCYLQSIHWLGFITIPLLSFGAFLLITVLLIILPTADPRSYKR